MISRQGLPGSDGLLEFSVTMVVAGCGIIVAIWGGGWPLAMWVATLLFAALYSHGTLRSAVGPLLMAFWLFYPDALVGMDGLALKVILQTLLLAAIAILIAPSGERLRRGVGLDKVLIVLWLTWGILAYAPVLAGYLAERLHLFRAMIFEDVPHFSSGLKTAIPLIGAAFATSAGLIAAGGSREAHALSRATIAASVFAVLVSLALFVGGLNLLPFEITSVTPGGRLHGFAIPDANGFARALLIPVLLISSWILFGPSGFWRKALIAPALGIIAVLLTQSRTTYLSMTAGLAILGLLALNRLRFWLLAALGAIGFTVTFFAARLYVVFSPGGERLSPQNFTARVELWQGVIDILKANPWFGAHPTGYVDQMINMGLIQEDTVQSAHNLYLWLGAEWGIPMIVLALLVMLAAAWHGWSAWRHPAANKAGDDVRPIGAFVLACSVAFFVHGLTEVVSPAFLFFILGLGIAVHSRAVRQGELHGFARRAKGSAVEGHVSGWHAPILVRSPGLSRADRTLLATPDANRRSG